MARVRSSSIRMQLRKTLPSPARLAQLARQNGAVERRLRKVRIYDLVWVMVLGFTVGRTRTLAGLRRSYERLTGQTIEESSFYKRISRPGFARLLKVLTVKALEEMAGVGRSLRGPLVAFRDVILTDSTVVRLHALLVSRYPACRTNHTKAALKAHMILSVRGVGKSSVKVTAERAHDGPIFRVGPWVKDHLLLFDLGYFRYQLFSCITRNGGYFLTRLKASANPTIVALNRIHRGRAIDVEGCRVQDVVDRMKRQVLDVRVEASFSKRRYGGRARRGRQVLRVVGILDRGSGTYHLYLTNVPPEKLSAEDIGAVYALRWQIELLFKELKSHYRMEDLPSSKPAVVEALLYAALLTLIASRRLLALFRRRRHVQAERFPEQRWAAVMVSMAAELLEVVTRPPHQIRDRLKRCMRLLEHEALDPNAHRWRLLQSVERRVHPIHPAMATTA